MSTSACEPLEQSHQETVAVVGPYSLSRSRVEQPYIYQLADTDSATAIHDFIQQWAYDKAFELEAIEKLSSRQELEQMIEAYRASLLKHLFEKQIIEEELDSTITSQELNEFYESNKTQYVLRSAIIRLHFIKLSRNYPKLDELSDLWNRYEIETAMDSLIDLCNESAESFLLEDSIWYKQEELEQIIPSQFLKTPSIINFRDQVYSDDTSKYYLRIIDRVPDTEIAPLSFIEKQARKVILFQRKQELIRKRREEIYRKALKAERIKLWTQ